MKTTSIFFSVIFFISIAINAQPTFPVNGVHDKSHITYAFTNARIVADAETTIDNGTLIIKDGLIVAVGKGVQVPKDAIVKDMAGKSIYPALIDAYTTYGMPEIKAANRGFAPQPESNTKGAYGWNQAVKPEIEAYKYFVNNDKSSEELRKLGFGTVLTYNKDGIVRGSAAVVSLRNAPENELIIKDKAAAMYSFDKGTSTQDYPSSLMGAIALLRQTYLDADWYEEYRKSKAIVSGMTEYNISLDAFNNLQTIPQIFETTDKFNALRADKIGDEFKVNYIIKGSGNEYQRLEEIKETKCKFILPLNFPVAYDVEDAYDAMNITLSELKHWELAPTNLAAFEKQSIPFAITTADIKDKKDFYKNLRKAIEYGLSEKQALNALTAVPAQLLNIDDKLGKLKAGMIASFIITSGNLFDEKNVIYENWIQGTPYTININNPPDIRAEYEMYIGADETRPFVINGKLDKLKAHILYDSTKVPVNIAILGNTITLTFQPKGGNGTVRFSGNFTTEPMKLSGRGQLPSGNWVDWLAAYRGPVTDENKKDTTTAQQPPQFGNVIYPFCAYGSANEKSPNTGIIIRNATVWTNEQEGILKEQDVYILNGQISKIGVKLFAPFTAKVIDGTGKHLTAGIIDEHSHIAISAGVNEGAQAATSEVRIGDVINSEDINIYRQLSGGVTTSQLLHGSANPIGGQAALIKLRWGKSPEELKFAGADGFIKFALGENVKQSNWGDFQTVRFPQTRMGVEQVYYDCFTRAKEYEAKQKGFATPAARTKEASIPLRRDLELEALVEILNNKRFITCHSYVQSEINMLMHVADSMKFKVNTFTHILEGYKVADKMKAHTAGAATFSDWWIYKMEVLDAIPYNASLLNQLGVVTAINSDDAEMGRRLNQEAAKSIKYGGMSEEDALKLVTLNPAKLLHIDDKVGSIKVGKDADVVLWSDNPLSVYAKVEKTIIDGIIYYDNDEDKKLRDDIQKERARIIQKMIDEKKGGAPVQKPQQQKQKLYHCDTMESDYLDQ